MKSLHFSFLFVFALFLSVQMSAQVDNNVATHTLIISIPEVALLDIEGGTSVTLTAVAPTEAGNPLNLLGTTNNTLYLNYSSIIGAAPDNVRKVSVAVTNGTLPSGIDLKVTASAATGDGAGTKGSPGSQMTLSNTAQDLITGIGSCYTGDGSGKGHQLTYVLTENSANYANLNFSTTHSLTITYTLSDN